MKNNGGPAFPTMATTPDGKFTVTHDGLSLRDWFAAKAMQALIVARSKELVAPGRGWPVHAEKDAYLIADAMIAERDKP